MILQLLLSFLVGLCAGSAVGYAAGVMAGKRDTLQVLQRYEASLRDMHGNQPTPATVLELPGLQSAIRYLLRLR